MYSAVTWSDFGIILRLLWVYEGGFGLLLGDFGITLDVVAGLMVSWSAQSRQHDDVESPKWRLWCR